ncbi:MAG: carbamoyl phosphate synthase large subunit, partial [bacterium]
GEVMGIASSFGLAFYKAEEATGMKLPTEGNCLISVAHRDKKNIIDIAKNLHNLGFNILATKGTKEYLFAQGIQTDLAVKLHEGRPNIADDIHNGKIQIIINTPIGIAGKHDDGYMRKAAVLRKIPYITTIAAAQASVEGIKAAQSGNIELKSIQEYHAQIHAAVKSTKREKLKI